MMYKSFEQLLCYINRIPKDKALHALMGMIAFSAMNLVMPHTFSLAIVVTFAIGKEVYDLNSEDRHNASFWDVIYGIGAPLVITLLDMIRWI